MENIENNLAIKVEELTKRFPRTLAVDKATFNVKKGEIFGFLGPNGAGKTTTINMLCTLLAPSSGQAVVNGFDVIKEAQEVRRSIGIVFQETTLDNHLTVEENLYLHAKLYGLTKNQFRKKLYPVLKLLELEDKKYSPVHQLSGGTRRRVEMARVFIHEPQILFLDEPTVGLDAQTKNKIWDYLMKMRKEYGTTIFLTTQYINEAEICDRIAIIDYGEIVACDTPDNLKKMISTDLIELKTRDNQSALVELKNNFPDLSIRQLGKNILIEAEDGETLVPQIIEKSAIKILSINLQKPTLEDIFLELTGRQIRDMGKENGKTIKHII